VLPIEILYDSNEFHRAIGVGCGFVITKADMFPPVAARGASQVILNVMVPALMFSKIVPAFNKSNIQAFGACLRLLESKRAEGLWLRTTIPCCELVRAHRDCDCVVDQAGLLGAPPV